MAGDEGALPDKKKAHRERHAGKNQLTSFAKNTQALIIIVYNSFCAHDPAELILETTFHCSQVERQIRRRPSRNWSR